MAQNKGNQFMIAVIKSPFSRLFAKGLAVITLKGRKTGNELMVPINVIEEDESYTVISKRERTWWRNLRGGTHAELFTNGKKVTVKGAVFETPEEVKEALSQFFKHHSNMAKYFKIKITDDGSLNEFDLIRAVNERVLIKLERLQ